MDEVLEVGKGYLPVVTDRTSKFVLAKAEKIISELLDTGSYKITIMMDTFLFYISLQDTVLFQFMCNGDMAYSQNFAHGSRRLIALFRLE